MMMMMLKTELWIFYTRYMKRLGEQQVQCTMDSLITFHLYSCMQAVLVFTRQMALQDHEAETLQEILHVFKSLQRYCSFACKLNDILSLILRSQRVWVRGYDFPWLRPSLDCIPDSSPVTCYVHSMNMSSRDNKVEMIMC